MKVDNYLSALKQPFKLGALELRNRSVMAPMTRMQTSDNQVDDKMVEYYRQRAAGGLGLIITEGVPVNDSAHGYDNVPSFYGESIESWRPLVEAVHAEGAKIMPQLWHVGSVRQAGKGPNPLSPIYGPSAKIFPDPNNTGLDLPTEMTAEQIEQVIGDFVNAAVAAKDLGFDGIELHGAHGYLLDQFMWQQTNVRLDEFGGDTIAERINFVSTLVKRVRAAVGPDFPIVLRISQWKMGNYQAKNAATPEELAEQLLPLAEAGVDIFHASTRRWWQAEFAGSVLNYAGWIQKITGKPTMTVGNIGVDHAYKDSRQQRKNTIIEQSYEQLDQRLALGEFDLFAIGRALLADANFVNKLFDNKESEIINFNLERHMPYKSYE
ncbi:oxidoreductase [Piscirickettsia litoralis]|uniref:NADH:flavin oxidoreductase/NADH oxidase N-terminal domain-containing protein n=1 Tax=Piscirickettsia litoralis TaxID=1891921 RepID=A0ABX3A331_9GAMM|nr:hypothetical protein [Piscirickettsia litoralis]ODN43276.1 hypothetical protein BGC07_10545 [Piscirickettsia litoralis]